MASTLLPPLPQLRHELETGATMDESLSLLLALRRTLVRHYHAVPTPRCKWHPATYGASFMGL